MTASTIAAARPDRPTRSVALLLGALLLLAVQDALVKLTSDSVSLWQFQLLRASLNAGLLALVGLAIAPARPRPPRRPGLVALRGALVAVSMLLFFGAVPFLSLAEIAAGLYCFPLFVTLFAAVLPGERVGWRRLSAVVAGFCGTALILKPGTDAFAWHALMPLGAAVSYAAMVMITRRGCRDEHPATLAFAVAGAFVVMGLSGLAVTAGLGIEGGAWPYLTSGWHPLSAPLLATIALCSILNLAANVGLTVAYQEAEASFLVPFDYSYLVFAAVVGGLVWGDWPDAAAWTGMALIAGAGVFVALRERARGTAPSPTRDRA
ncbi:MAG: DMT family transporter [Paracoccaceae bacterium]